MQAFNRLEQPGGLPGWQDWWRHRPSGWRGPYWPTPPIESST